MPDTTARHLTSGVGFTPQQMDTIRRALEDADALQTESLDGWCRDCERARATPCDEHAAAAVCRQEYRDLRCRIGDLRDRRDLGLEAGA